MNGFLEFDLDDEDDIMAHKRCIKAQDMGLALWDIQYNLVKYLERKLENDPDVTDKEYALLEHLRTEISDIFDNYGILIDDLIK
jgi:hypothetical protein